MKLDAIKEQAGRDESLTEVTAFRLTAQEKEAFLAVCEQHRLSIGKTIRALLNEFVEQAKKESQDA